MKALENKSTRILKQMPVEGQPDVFCRYGDLILTAVNSTGSQERFSPSEIRRRIRIMKAVEKAEKDGADLILFEDHDADKLQEVIKQSKWPYIHEDITLLEDDILAMKYESEARKALDAKAEALKADETQNGSDSGNAGNPASSGGPLDEI